MRLGHRAVGAIRRRRAALARRCCRTCSVAGVDLVQRGLPVSWRRGEFALGGVPARLFRISFSGELAYEIAVPARYGDALIRALMQAGGELGVTPYGIEALGVMRIEKGHVAGTELNGQTTARDLGLGRMMSTKKDYIGRVHGADARRWSIRSGRRSSGFRPVDRGARLRAGAHFLKHGARGDAPRTTRAT